MSVDIQPFEPADLGFIRVRPEYADTLAMVLGVCEVRIDAQINEWCYTAWGPYGNALACCGITDDGEAWAFVDPGLRRRETVAVCRAVMVVLEEHLLRVGPVFARIRKDVPVAKSWACLLGFTKVGIGTSWVYQ